MGDIFSTFFGGAAAGGRQVRKDGRDMGVGIRITLKEAATGEKKEIVYDRLAPCPDCDGTGLGEGRQGGDLRGMSAAPGRVVSVAAHLLGRHADRRAPAARATAPVTAIDNPCPECEGQGRAVPDRQRVHGGGPRAASATASSCVFHGFGEAGHAVVRPAGDLIVTVPRRPRTSSSSATATTCTAVPTWFPWCRRRSAPNIEVDGIFEDEKVTVAHPRGPARTTRSCA